MYKTNYTILSHKSQGVCNIKTPIGVCQIIVSLVLISFLLLPSPYIVESPGPSVDVLDNSNDKKLINYNGESYEFDGHLYLLSVSIYGGPSSYSNTLSKLPALFDRDQNVLPAEAIYPPNQDVQVTQEQVKEQMVNSQSSAITAAVNYLRTQNLQVDTDAITISIEDIGGPSAGLAFALGIIQKIGGINLTNGRTIAVTGTISETGSIGSIGGVQQKMVSAYRNGARTLLVTSQNFLELHDIPNDLEVHRVQNLDEAVSFLTSSG